MLYSRRDDCWKLADFGSAAEGTSKHLNTTRWSRGTACYRAPEVVTDGRYDTKADIFALGCVIYEILTGLKLFSDDWAVHEYAQTNIQIVADRWPRARLNTPLFEFRKMTAEMVKIDPFRRPNAETVLRRLFLIKGGVSQDLIPTQQENPVHSVVRMYSSPVLTVTPAIQSCFVRQVMASESTATRRVRGFDLYQTFLQSKPVFEGLSPAESRRLAAASWGAEDEDTRAYFERVAELETGTSRLSQRIFLTHTISFSSLAQS